MGSGTFQAETLLDDVSAWKLSLCVCVSGVGGYLIKLEECLITSNTACSDEYACIQTH